MEIWRTSPKDILIGVYILVIAVSRLANALVCLNCDAVIQPRFCKHVTTCFKGEKCGMTYTAQNGQLLYKLGCVDENTCDVQATEASITDHDVYACNHCCDDQDLCNARGCNSTGFPFTRGPLCYNCEAYPAGYPCHSIEHCETNEICYNDVNLEFTSDTLHYSGCRSKHNCAGSHIDPSSAFGKRAAEIDFQMDKRSTKTCTSCCHGDLCNVQCQSADVCHDEPTCQQLMSNYDVCETPDIAKQFCKKSCNLCVGAPVTCSDTRLDCAYINGQVNMCSTKQDATVYGCLDFCGYCTVRQWTTATQTTGQPWTYTSHPPSTPSSTTTTTTTTAKPIQIANTTLATVTYFPGTNATSTSMNYTTQSTTAVNTSFTKVPTYGPVLAHALYIGARVQRGQDWKWNTQDSNGPGTVISFPPSTDDGWVRVRWDGGTTNTYRMGADNAYDLMLVPGTFNPPSSTVVPNPFTLPSTTPSTSTSSSYGTTALSTAAPLPTYGPALAQALYIGARVQRGKDWKWNDQDGNGPGTVTAFPPVTSKGWVKVLWDNNQSSNSYRMGETGHYDLMFVPGTYNPASANSTATLAPYTTSRP